MSDITEKLRENITALLLSDDITVSVLGGNGDIPDELLWKKLIPQQYVPDTVDQTGSYLMYDIDEETLFPVSDGRHLSDAYGRRGSRAVYTEITLKFWAVTHRRTPAYLGRLRNDILSERIRNIFSEKRRLGAAPCHFLYSRVFFTGRNEYTGREIAFKITDIRRRCRYE